MPVFAGTQIECKFNTDTRREGHTHRERHTHTQRHSHTERGGHSYTERLTRKATIKLCCSCLAPLYARECHSVCVCWCVCEGTRVSVCKFRSRLLLYNAARAFNSRLSFAVCLDAKMTLRKIMLSLFIA